MTTTPEFGFPRPSDQTRIATFPKTLRDLSDTLEAKIPGAITKEARAQLPGVVDTKLLQVTAAVATATATAAEARSASSTARAEAGVARSESTSAAALARSSRELSGQTAARMTALEAAHGFGPSTPEDGTVAAFVSQDDTETALAVDARSRARTRTVYPEDFGAKGDGLTDDTAALEAWLASPGLSLRMGAGLYKAARPLTSTVAGRTIWSDGGWIRSTALEQPALTITGANTRAKVCINGTNNARVGVMVKAGGCDTSGSEVLECRSTSSAAAGVWAETAFGFRCVGGRIERIHSVGNTTTGDSNGAARGIYLGGPGIVATRPSLIAENEITDVTGEEGDSIQVIATSAAGEVFGSMLCTVRGNIITGFSRRAIKVQASDVTVEGNRCTDLGTQVTGTEHAVIYMLNQHGGRITGNVVRGPRFAYGIYAYNMRTAAPGGVPNATRTVIDGNDIEVGPTGRPLVVAWMVKPLIRGNVTRGGEGIHLSGLTSPMIWDNVAHDGDIFVEDTCTSPEMRGNRALGSGSVRVQAPNSRPMAFSRLHEASVIQTNTWTPVRWGSWWGTGATHSAGTITPTPGRWRITATVAGSPAVVNGIVQLRVSRGAAAVGLSRTPVTSTGLQTWTIETVTDVEPGQTVSVDVYQTTGQAMPLDSTPWLAKVSLERID